MDNSFIKIHRSFTNHWLFNEDRPLTKREAWETILLTVYENECIVPNEEDPSGITNCKPGECILPASGWAYKFRWQEEDVYSFFRLLEKDCLIVLNRTQTYFKVIVVNYKKYVGKDKKTRATTIERIPRPKFVPPSLREVKEYFDTNGYKETSAIKFFNFYGEGDWHDSRGNKVKNWKQKAQAVWFRPENMKEGEDKEKHIYEI